MEVVSVLKKLQALGKSTWQGDFPGFGVVAVRELHNITLEDAQARLLELSACEAVSLTIPYVVYEDHGRLFALRPWVEGQPLKPKCDAQTAYQIVALLAKLPSEFVVYDLRPEHLIKQNDKIIFCDPGFEERGHSPYCAPEQVNRGEIDANAGDYQLGATLYHLLSGRIPPDAQTLLIPDVELEPIEGVPENINKKIELLFDADPFSRPNPNDLLADFEAWSEQEKRKQDEDAQEQALLKLKKSNKRVNREQDTRELAIESEFADDADPLAALFAKNTRGLKRHFEDVDWSVVLMVALPLLGTLCIAGALIHYNVVDFKPEQPREKKVAQARTPGGDYLPPYWISPKDGAPMILIPAGPFYSGPVPAAGKSAVPLEVNLPAYYIDRYEVTNRQFKKFVEATHYKAQGNWQESASDDRMDHPVIRVSYYDCEAYARWAGKRLPTADEWEKAARGGDLRLYPWGGTTPDPTRCNYIDTGIGNTTPVGFFPTGASPYGVEDMAGNVWEWVDTWFIPYDADDNYLPMTKVIKGGSRSDSADNCTIVQEQGVLPEQGRLVASGFRCVFSPEGQVPTSSSGAVEAPKKLRPLDQLMPKPTAKPEEPSGSPAQNFSNGEGAYDNKFDSSLDSSGGDNLQPYVYEGDGNSYTAPDNSYVGTDYGDNDLVYQAPEVEEAVPQVEAENTSRTDPGSEADSQGATPASKPRSYTNGMPVAPKTHTSPNTVIPDLKKGSSSGYVDEDQVNYYE
ncbi:MAG: SUMF1/EgtB/PvdO family nonheme iron enzyme [bacterium]|nr:SUMF1/EgtB/PvdO family nonheme iron enzyme [bacterium]